MFINLHNHTMYSLLDSISKPEDIVNKLKQIKQNAFAVTDHGHCYNTPQIYKLFKDNGIKLIYGIESYICKDMDIKDKNDRYNHLVLLAYNETGRLNINKLIHIGNTIGKYYKPRIDYSALVKHKEGLIVLSACMASEIQRAITEGDITTAKNIASKYKKDFGENYYLEIQSHRGEQLQINKSVLKIANELDIPYVITSDSHYINEEDMNLHSVFVTIDQKRDVGESYKDCFIQSEEDVYNILSSTLTREEIKAGINNTQIIAGKCNVDIPLSAPVVPHMQIPDKFNTELDYLKHLCNKGWIKRGINKKSKEEQKEYKDRLFYEIDAIVKMGFESYFLMVYDYANIAKRRGIARGSAGGSLVAYLLNIVDIDPIRYKLYFERFIDVSALDLIEKGQITKKELKIPDVDLDFGEEDRSKILEYITRKYGRGKVVSIGTFHFLKARGAIKDIGRALGVSFEVTNKMTKNIENETIYEALELGLLDEYKEDYSDLFNYATKLSGLPKSFGVHACGKIISTQVIDYYHPTTEVDGNIVYECDMDAVESLGLVKIDLLGLRTIDMIYDTLDMIGEDYNYINPNTIDFYNDDVLKVFNEGLTNGIFQFESDGMKKVLDKVQVSGIEDIGACNALYRPGAKNYIDDYAARKNGLSEIEYLHPDLEPILKETYGCLVYQEQLIEIGRLANLKNPDLLRKATGKKIEKLLNSLETEVKDGLINRGWKQEQVNKIWDDMVMFGKYAFNKSHSSAYGIIAYMTAYLKHYHPKEFYACLLNSYKGDIKKISNVLKEKSVMGIKIEPFNWRNTSSLCNVVDGKIRYGISLIKGLNDRVSDELSALSDMNFDSFSVYLSALKEKTSLNSKQTDILIKLNFFNEFGESQKLLNVYEIFSLLYGKKQIKKEKVKELKLPEDIIKKHSRETGKSYLDCNMIEIIKEYENSLPNKKLDIEYQLQAETEFLGMPITRYKTPTDYVAVLGIDTKYTPRLTCYQLNNGTIKTYTLWKNKLYSSPTSECPEVKQLINKHDIIEINKGTYEKKKKLEDGTKVGTGEFVDTIKSFVVLRKYIEKDVKKK